MHEGQFFISVAEGAADLQNPAAFSFMYILILLGFPQ